MSTSNENRRATLSEWIAVLSTIACAFLANLDSGIAGATIREVQGSLGSGVEEGSWISTCYLLGEIIAIPVAVYFANIFSPRRFLLFCTINFVLISIYCGMATSLPHMLSARFLQGLTGGTLRPMASYIIIMLLPVASRQLALLIFALLTSIAPAIGAVIGGWVAINYSWTACFYIQVIPGMLMIGLIFFFLKPTPMNLKELLRADWLTMIALSIGLCLLIFILQEGNRLDWYSDPDIQKATIACVVALALAGALFHTSKNPFLQMSVLFRRNFLAANAASALVRVAMYANLFLMTLFLTRIQGYDSLQCGKVALWFGLPQIVIFPFVVYLVRNFDARWVVVVGIATFIISCLMNSNLDHFAAGDFFFWSQIIGAVGQPLLLAPLTGIAYMGIDSKHAASASALYNLVRAIGSAMGVAFLGVLLNSRQRLHFGRIVEKANDGNQLVTEHLEKYSKIFSDHGMNGDAQALLKLKQVVEREAFTMAYADTYWLISGILVLGIFAVLLARKDRKARIQVKKTHHGAAIIEGHHFPLSDLSAGGFGFTFPKEFQPYFSLGTFYEKIILEFAGAKYLVDAEVAMTKTETIAGGTCIKAGMRFVNLSSKIEKALSREASLRAPKTLTRWI